MKYLNLLFKGSLLCLFLCFFSCKRNLTKNDEHTIAKTEITKETEPKTESIETLTNERRVISYLLKYHHLPDFYITKNEARDHGWIPSKQNLCDVLPGRAIGGNHFSNREKKLPKNKHYYEADVNYRCGNRGTDRVIFTKEGEVWLTKNHYRTFEKQ